MRLRAALALVSLLALAGCRATSNGEEQGLLSLTPRVLADQVESLANAGRLAEAEALLQAAYLDGLENGEATPIALLEFTGAWLHHLRALSSPEPARSIQLEDAVNGYRFALDLSPGEPESSQNLTLALRELTRFEEAFEVVAALGANEASRAALLEGLLLADERNPARDPSLALERLREGGLGVTLEPGAAMRVILLFGELIAQEGPGDGRETLLTGLFDVASEYAQRGFGDAAVRGFEIVMASCSDLAPEALVAWVRTEAERGGLTLERLAETPDCPPVREAATELGGLLRAPGDLARVALSFWRASEVRIDSAVSALRALGTARLLSDEPAEAAELLRTARELGRDGSFDLWLDVSLDLAVVLHTHRALLDPASEELIALVDASPLDTVDETRPKVAAGLLARRGAEDAAQIHAVLGAVHDSLGRWRGRAQYHLESALALEAASAERSFHTERIGHGLTRSTNPLEFYLEAARRHLARGDREAALNIQEPAQRYARETRSRAREIDELLYPTAGLYIGASVGPTNGHTSGTELQGALLSAGHTTNVELDDRLLGARLAVGYRFRRPFAIELGYTTMEGPESRIQELTMPPMAGQLVRDVAELHPFGGKGPTASVMWFPVQQGRLSGYLEAGLWRWESVVDIDLLVGGQSVRIDEDGIDLFFGAGAEFRLLHSLRARGAFQRYVLDDDEVDLLSIGLVLGL